MVDYIFFLDTVWNEAMEEQIIARAHRLGNTNQSIVVDNLLYDGTIELLMKKKFIKQQQQQQEEEEQQTLFNEEKENKSKMKFLLRNLKLI